MVGRSLPFFIEEFLYVDDDGVEDVIQVVGNAARKSVKGLDPLSLG